MTQSTSPTSAGYAELLPCPFCGWNLTADEGLCSWDKDEFGETVDEIIYTGVSCPGCSAFVPQNSRNKAEAIAAWNRRAPLPKPVAAGVTDRDFLGRKVREAWIKWALTQPNPKPSWLVPYDELSEPDKEADRQIGDAIAALSLLAPETEGFVLREPGEEVVIFLQGVGGIVEASRAEQSQLWGYHHETRRWEENLSGYGQVVGRLGDMPICISLCTANISGRKILFWHATSQVVDYRLIDAWLDKNLPRVPKTDAANFVNILPTLTKEPNKNG